MQEGRASAAPDALCSMPADAGSPTLPTATAHHDPRLPLPLPLPHTAVATAHCHCPTLPHTATAPHLQITDRSKDVIKSGGEWISSIEIENAAVGHPQVAGAPVPAGGG